MKRFFMLFIALACLINIALPINALDQSDLLPNVAMIGSFTGNGGEVFNAVTPSYDNSGNIDGYIAVGSTTSNNSMYDMKLTSKTTDNEVPLIVKYDLNGNVDTTWKNHVILGNGYSRFLAITQSYDENGKIDGYVVVGHTRSYEGLLNEKNYGGNDALIIRFNLDGSIDESWGPLHFGGNLSDEFYSIIPSLDNTGRIDGYIASGNTTSNSNDLSGRLIGNRDALVVKFKLNGEVDTNWDLVYGHSNASYWVTSSSYSYDASGEVNGYIIAGYVEGNPWLLKYNLNGSIDSTWIPDYFSDDGSQAYEAITPSYDCYGNIDGYIIVGSFSVGIRFEDIVQLAQMGGTDAYIIKHDLEGKIVKGWGPAIISSDVYETFSSITQSYDSSGKVNGYIVVGHMYESILGVSEDVRRGGVDAIIVRYTLDGDRDLDWNRLLFGGSRYDSFNGIAPSFNDSGEIDGVVAVGSTQNTDGDLTGYVKFGNAAIIVKFTSNNFPSDGGGDNLINTGESANYLELYTVSSLLILTLFFGIEIKKKELSRKTN